MSNFSIVLKLLAPPTPPSRRSCACSSYAACAAPRLQGYSWRHISQCKSLRDSGAWLCRPVGISIGVGRGSDRVQKGVGEWVCWGSAGRLRAPAGVCRGVWAS